MPELSVGSKQKILSDLIWAIGYIEGLKLGQEFKGARGLRIDDLEPVERRMREIFDYLSDVK